MFSEKELKDAMNGRFRMKVESQNGKTYFLHSTRSKNRRFAYFFSKEEAKSIPMPNGYEIGFSKNGLPHLKKIVGN